MGKFAMSQILQSALALICLLALALIAAAANGADWQEPDPPAQPVCAQAAVSGRPRLLPLHGCLVPGPQPGTHLVSQPFAYGYFGARPQTVSAYHRGSTGDWFQWTFLRAN
jgi:hypothetical protein